MKKYLSNLPIFKTTSQLILIALAGLMLRLIFLNSRPPTYDEAFTLAQIKATWPQLLKSTFSGFNPPFYFILLKILSKINTSLVFLRLLSTVFGTLAVLMMGLTAKKLFGSKIAVLSSFLLAISPAAVFESTNLRMYGLALIESILIIYFFLELLKTGRLPFFWGLGLSLLLALYTHYYFGLVVLVLNFIFFLYQKKKLVKQWLWLQIGLAFCFFPFLALVFHSPRPLFFSATQSLLKIPGVFVTFGVSWDSLQILKLFPFSIVKLPNVFLFLLTFSLLLAFFRGLKVLKKRFQKYFLLSYIFLPLILVFISSSLFKPVFGLRSFVIFCPAYYYLVSFGLSNLKERYQSLILGLFLLFSCLLVYQYLGFKQSWSDTSPYLFVKQNSTPGDLFIHADPSTFLLGRFYLVTDSHFSISSSWYPAQVETAIGYQLLEPNKLPVQAKRMWYFLQENQYFNKDLAWKKQKEFSDHYPIILTKIYPSTQLRLTLFDLENKQKNNFR